MKEAREKKLNDTIKSMSSFIKKQGTCICKMKGTNKALTHTRTHKMW